MGTTKERRRSARETVDRPCKVFRPATQRYAAARTRDISSSGALLEIESARPLRLGERLDVAVSWTRTAVLPSSSLMEAKVVRVRDLGRHRHAVALEFAEAAVAAAVA